jgi:sensor histidine kinase YesM
LEWLPRISGNRINRIPAIVIAVPTGFVIGAKISTLFGAPDFIGDWLADPVREWRSIGASSMIVISAAAFMYVYANSVAARLELQIERRHRAEASRAQAIAELGLLQAQIEPHFLFNTLAHVQSAFDQDPSVGKEVLEHLIRYLRGTLTRSRNAHCTLAEEATLIESLLIIAGIRLGPRLSSQVIIEGDLGKSTLPPLLLQPLVENAIKHGIEPAIEGGKITVTAAGDGATLILRVSDTGVGMGSATAVGADLNADGHHR